MTTHLGYKVEVTTTNESQSVYQGLTGVVVNVRRCPALFREELLVEFSDGERLWFAPWQLTKKEE